MANKLLSVVVLAAATILSISVIFTGREIASAVRESRLVVNPWPTELRVKVTNLDGVPLQVSGSRSSQKAPLWVNVQK
jgi:hypothetical protein